MRPTNEEITRHHFDTSDADPWVGGHGPAPYEIRVVEYDERWPADFARVAESIRGALGDRALEVHHVGSTSVPGLPAKPVIDVDLVVADSADEASYIPDLEAAGFVHTVREPWWHEHRLVKYADPVAYVHIFGPDCPEVRALPGERSETRSQARRLRSVGPDRSAATSWATRLETRSWSRQARPTNTKEPVVHGIYERMFRAHGLIE